MTGAWAVGSGAPSPASASASTEYQSRRPPRCLRRCSAIPSASKASGWSWTNSRGTQAGRSPGGTSGTSAGSTARAGSCHMASPSHAGTTWSYGGGGSANSHRSSGGRPSACARRRPTRSRRPGVHQSSSPPSTSGSGGTTSSSAAEPGREITRDRVTTSARTGVLAFSP